jgi:hypothetical protein
MSYTVKLKNEYLPQNVVVKDGTLNIYIDENDKKTLSFVLIDRTGGNVNYITTEYEIGTKVEVYEDSKLIFGGQLDELKRRKINRTYKSAEMIATDWNFLAEKRYINGIYYKQPISDIIKKIIDEYFADDNILYNNETIDEVTNEVAINCSYAQAQDVFDELSDLIGYKWNIGDNKYFYFKERGNITGPDIVEEHSDYLFESLRYSDNRNNYRNTQILKKVNALTSQLTEKATPTPDSDNAFTVRLPLDSKPEIWITDDINVLKDDPLNGYYQVDPTYVGIGGLSEGLVWYYWNKGSNTISKDPTNAPDPDPTFFVVVKYIGQFQFDLVREDYDGITNRAKIEGGSGIYENIEDGSNIDGVSVAENKISALLQKYAKIENVIEFASNTLDIDMNFICDMTFPSFNIENESYLLIKKVITNTGGRLLLKKYTFISGNAFDGWVTFFKKWLASAKDYTLRESEEVIQQIRSKELFGWDGTITLDTLLCLYPANDLYPNVDPNTGGILYPGRYTDTDIYHET